MSQYAQAKILILSICHILLFNYYIVMLFDLHVHSQYSDCSSLTVDAIVRHARSRGLDGVCITDHNSERARQLVPEGVLADGLRLFVGQEYETTDGDFLVFCPDLRLPENLTATRLLAFVQTAGGAAIAAHPLRSGRPTSEHIVQQGLCRIVESVNGRNTPSENRGLEAWRQKYNLVECAGSDAHHLDELGSVKTRFSIPLNTPADLVWALNQGLCSPDLSGRS